MIGKMERVDLRKVWKNEVKDFSNWLFENIEILAEELDIDLTAVEKEKKIGSFSADIIAEGSTGETVLIENQLGKTDHDHLGKILTYVSNLDAKKAIWISKEPRSEHERATEWLNELSADIDFYLVKVEAYKIGDSDPAPKFTVIAGPTESGKVAGSEKKELAERHKKRLKFWKGLLEKSKKRTSLHSNISPSINSWISTGSGKGGLVFSYVVTYKHGQIELYIDRGKDSQDENKKIFDELESHIDEIEKEFGSKLKWERLDDRRASRISKRFDYAGLDDEEKKDKLQDDMVDGMIRLEKSLKKYIRNLKI
jgi:hypothetical protein